MTKLDQRALGIVPLSKETILSFYDGTRSGTALSCLEAACESHERLRMELDGMDTMLKEDDAKIKTLRGMIEYALQAPTWKDCLCVLHDALAGKDLE